MLTLLVQVRHACARMSVLRVCVCVFARACLSVAQYATLSYLDSARACGGAPRKGARACLHLRTRVHVHARTKSISADLGPCVKGLAYTASPYPPRAPFPWSPSKQDSHGGLEAQLAGGEWIKVPSREGMLVVNLGEMLQVCVHKQACRTTG